MNRRISIIVLNESEMANILHEYEGAVPVTDLQQLKHLPPLPPHSETPVPPVIPPEVVPETAPEPAAPDQTPPQSSAAAADTTQ